MSSWGSDEKGYALPVSVFIDQWWLFIQIQYTSSSGLPILNIILSILLTLMISFGCYHAIWAKGKLLPRFLEIDEEEDDDGDDSNEDTKKKIEEKEKEIC